ncbi:outer membrane protein transport protein, partial [candidate division WOR-3 bacterium]|nr:outer membrane protein transport protein [candidate division WOR-3 bacterium]
TWKTDMDFRIVGDRPRLRQIERTRNRIDWDWKASNRYRFGGEYNLTEELALRGGFYYDESPVPDEQVSFTNIADVDRKGITLGTGYGWKKFMFDFLYEYHWGEREVDDIKYSQKINAYTLALSYQL